MVAGTLGRASRQTHAAYDVLASMRPDRRSPNPKRRPSKRHEPSDHPSTWLGRPHRRRDRTHPEHLELRLIKPQARKDHDEPETLVSRDDRVLALELARPAVETPSTIVEEVESCNLEDDAQVSLAVQRVLTPACGTPTAFCVHMRV